MQRNEKTETIPDITELSNELTYQKYLMNKDQIRRFFRELSLPEYIVLYIIAGAKETEGEAFRRVYLKDLAERMQLTIRQTSKMVGALKERGLLLWSHDGNGSEGTYVVITDSGKKLLGEEENVLKEYYGRVIEKYGKENLIQLLQLMRQLQTVMRAEIEEMGVTEDEEGFDE